MVARMSILIVEKTRVYYGGPCYRASVEGEPLAICKGKDDAASEAIDKLYSAYAVSSNPPAMARLADGRYIIGIEISKSMYGLFHFDADGKRSATCELSSREIAGRTCTLEEYVQYSAHQANGVDYWEAVRLVMEGI